MHRFLPPGDRSNLAMRQFIRPSSWHCGRRIAAVQLLLWVLALGAPAPAAAVDAFEIQVYDGTANEPGALGLELHLNRVFAGARSSTPPELPLHHQTHFTFEPSFGLTSYWELGAYLQTTLRGDGAFDYSGLKLRSKFVTPPAFHPHLRFGANLEFSRVPVHYDRARWSTELRPIAAWDDAHFIFAINPILDFAWTGPEMNEGPGFEPAAMAKVKVFGWAAVGVEYYASLGPLASPVSLRDQLHYLYEAVDLLSAGPLELNLAIGEGLTRASSDFVAKLIVGYSSEPRATTPLGPAQTDATSHGVKARVGGYP